MSSTLEHNRLFPPDDGAEECSALRVARLSFILPPSSGIVMDNRTFLRAWAGRKAVARVAAGVKTEKRREPAD